MLLNVSLTTMSFSKTMHQCILSSTQSNYSSVELSTSFLLSYGPITVDSLTPLTTRFRESYSSMSIWIAVTTERTVNNTKTWKSPNSRTHRPICGWCYLFTVSSSGLLFLHIAETCFPNFALSLSAKKNEYFPHVTSTFDLWPWPVY